MDNQDFHQGTAFGGNGAQGNRVTFQDQANEISATHERSQVELGSEAIAVDDEENVDIVHDLNADGNGDGASNNYNDYDPGLYQRGGLKPPVKRQHSEHVGSHSRNREMADNLQAQFNAIDGDIREPSMPGSGGQGFDVVDESNISGIGGGLVQKEVVTYNVDLALSQDEFMAHMDDANLAFKDQLMKKVQLMQTKDLHVLNNKVSFIRINIIQVEELKQQEGKELSQLNKQYQEIDATFKKKDRKVSVSQKLIFVEWQI